MAHIRPFAAIRYQAGKTLNMSDVLAPPYDVLDQAAKDALQAKHPNNIVTVDCPWMPPKTLGPDEVYERANTTFQSWLSAGILKRDRRPAIYPYAQAFEHNGKTFHRRGFVCLVRLSPFGQGQVVPHEKTHDGPIEDRLKLMRTTGVQLSPIFGLFNDDRHDVTKLLYQNAGRPELDGTLDGIRHQLWSVTDNNVENQIIDLMGTRPVYIADGHHRYTTALQFQKQMEQEHGGPLPPEHPANWCMFVLVGMQNDGLLILPTHRMIGGIESFSIDALRASISDDFALVPSKFTPEQIGEFAERHLPGADAHTFGLFEGRSRTLFELMPKNPDVLEKLAPDRSDAWRKLDVAILQRYLIEKIIQPEFAQGREPRIGYTADARTIPQQVDGQQYQIALLVRPTPLHALEELGRAGEVMPQKSTYFYPKLATGMTIYPLR